jgi:hypothetical protein
MEVRQRFGESLVLLLNFKVRRANRPNVSLSGLKTGTGGGRGRERFLIVALRT